MSAASGLNETISDAAFAFRGYNIKNLGRTNELLSVPAYRSQLIEELERFDAVCQETTGVRCDLLSVVEDQIELGLDKYPQAIALIVAVEAAQMRILAEVHGVEAERSAFFFGYSLGEVIALCMSGAFAAEDLIRTPLAIAADCAEMAADAQLGILFSRGPAIAERDVHQICTAVSAEGSGIVGVSAVLSPNTYLLIGQYDSLSTVKRLMKELLPRPAQLRINSHRWPPLHTPIVRQRHVPDRSSVMLDTTPGGTTPCTPPVFSLVTGDRAYDTQQTREVLRDWSDHPQRLWDAVCETLSSDVDAVVHVGPAPNVIPATFARLSENVQEQTKRRSIESLGIRAMSGLARRPWLASLLPSRAALLRAPYIRHILLEDWLLEHSP